MLLIIVFNRMDLKNVLTTALLYQYNSKIIEEFVSGIKMGWGLFRCIFQKPNLPLKIPKGLICPLSDLRKKSSPTRQHPPLDNEM